MKRPPLLVPLLFAASLAAPPAQAARCFSMFDARNALVYQTANPPIDLSRSISDQMARRFPARYLVISDAGSCPESVPGSVTSGSGAAALLPTRGAADGGYPPDPGPADPTPGRDVPVRGYTRDDGTTVQAHTRASPGTAAGGAGVRR